MTMRIVRGLTPPAPEERTYPLTDEEAWLVWGGHVPELFDRMWIARSQGLEAHPHGVEPAGQVFSRPLINLWGMGVGARLIEHWSNADYQAGHFWMPYLQGAHWSCDYVFEQGTCVFAYRVLCHKDTNRSFVRFEGYAGEGPRHAENLAWVSKHLPLYTGPINVETIGEHIIEVHLRPNSDFLTFYGQPFLDALQQMCNGGPWHPIRAPQDATVIPIRVARDVYGPVFSIEQGALEQMETALVALDFQNGVSLAGSPDDGFTWRLALVGDPEPDWADNAARHLAENIEVLEAPGSTQ